jgi:hypothetical protein
MAITALFFALRIAFLVARPPFFDELFTRWITSLEPRSIAEALRHDSGPPFYYLLVRTLTGGGARIAVIRIVSLVSSFGSLLVVAVGPLVRSRLGEPSRWWTFAAAAALFAVYPPAVFAAADARAYALAGFFIAIACVALHGWALECGGHAAAFVGSSATAESSTHDGGATPDSSRAPAGHGPADEGGGMAAALQGRPTIPLLVASGALLLAAGSHYYGVLFFPLPAVLGLMQRTRRAALAGIASSVVCGLLYAPGFWLAAQQPAAAVNWMGSQNPLAPLSGLAFAANYPGTLFPAVPVWLVLAALIALVLMLLRAHRSVEATRFAAMTLVPLVAVVLLSLAGRRVYFPPRFEMILAAPLALWLAFALRGWSVVARRALLAAMLAIGVVVCLSAVAAWRIKRPDSYRAAALFARSQLDSRSVIVAGGYSYLETISQRDRSWHPRVIALPPEMALHPGWYEQVDDAALRRTAAQIIEVFPQVIWIGPRHADELSALASQGRVEPLWSDGVVMVARIVGR